MRARPDVLHHAAPCRWVADILEQGLRTGMPPGLSSQIGWATQWYGTNPVFLGMPGSGALDLVGEWHRDDGTDHESLAVDVHGLSLVADLGSLCDLPGGGRHEEGYVVFSHPWDLPAVLQPFLDDSGALEIEFLLDPSSDACKAAIMATGSCACLEDIAPDRLSRLPGAELPRGQCSRDAGPCRRP